MYDQEKISKVNLRSELTISVIFSWHLEPLNISFLGFILTQGKRCWFSHRSHRLVQPCRAGVLTRHRRGMLYIGPLHFHYWELIGKGVRELADFQLHSLASRSECARAAVFLGVIWQPGTCLLGQLFEPQLFCGDR